MYGEGDRKLKDYCRTGMSLEEIRQNKKIVDVFLSTFKKYQSFRDITATSILADIFKEATGKDIDTIHSQENIKN